MNFSYLSLISEAIIIENKMDLYLLFSLVSELQKNLFSPLLFLENNNTGVIALERTGRLLGE